MLAAGPLLAGAAAGILLADSPDSWLPLCAAGAAVLSLLAGLGFLADEYPAGVAAAVAIGCAAGGVSLGVAGARDAYRPSLLTWFDARAPGDRDAPAVLEGVLRVDAAPAPFGASITIDVVRGGGLQASLPPGDRPPSPDAGLKAGPTTGSAGFVRGGVRLSIGGSAAAGRVADWRAGRTVRVAASLRRPTPFGNPGLPDETRALARRGIALVGSVKSAALVDVVARGRATEEAAAAARAWARRQLARYVGSWSAQSGAIAAAILIGDRSGLSDEDERRLQEAGTYHVIAISGGNIAILTVMLLVAMRALRLPPRAASAVAIAVLLFYGQLAGGGASVSRAVAAACVYLAGRMLDHRGPALNALAVTAILGVAASPLAAFDAGFILSFGATLGILLGASRLGGPGLTRERDAGGARRFVRRATTAAAALFAATVCAELALAPAGAILFSRITLAGLVLNFAAIPLMTIAQTASMATLAASVSAEPVGPVPARPTTVVAQGPLI